MHKPVVRRAKWQAKAAMLTAFSAVTAVWGTAEPALAQAKATLENQNPDEIRANLERTRETLQQTLGRAGEIEADVAKLDAERERINTQLLETAASIQISEGKLTEIEGRLEELGAKEKMVRGSLDQRHQQIATLLAALQRMGRNPPPVIVTQRQDALQMVRSAMLLASAFPGMRQQALELADTLSDLMRVTAESRAESERLKSETARLSELRTRLAGVMETKRQSITERQSELKQVQAAAAEISRKVNDLTELITELDRTVAKNTGLEAYDAALLKAGTEPAAAPPSQNAQADKDETAPSAPTRVVELAPGTTALMPGSASRIAPAIPFHLAKAKLPLPAHGRRVLSYGERTQYGSKSKGLVLETRSGAQVTSPCDGWIVYAGEFRSYGKLLIINGGGGYHILLAGLSQIDVQPGQFVLAAEPVGTMSVAGKETTGVGNSAPVLYIEFRKDGQPIDPDPWWAVGLQKAQG